MENRWGRKRKQWLYFLAPKSLQAVTAAMKFKENPPLKKIHDKRRQHIKKQRHYFAKGLSSQSYGLSSSHVQMWELDHKEGWAWKNWCFWTVVLEKTLESSLHCKEIKLGNSKGDQPWIFIGGVDAETPIFWPPDAKSWLIGRDADVGKDWRQEEKGTTEDEIVGWHYRLSGHESEQTLGAREGQRSLVHCSPWGHAESDMTEWLNNNEEATRKIHQIESSTF